MNVCDPGWAVHAVDPGVAVRVTRALPALPAALEAEVAALWTAAQGRMGGRLFNGRVFSVDALTPSLVTGHWTEFRRVVARMARPELAEALPVRPLAAGGVIVGEAIGGEAIGGGAGEAAFVVFGRRPAGAIYQAGEWQLPPAGSLDPTAARDDGVVDPVAQLLSELDEELGMPADAVGDARKLCIVEHPGSGVLDLGIAVRTTWQAAAIHAAHAARGNGEYAPLELVPVAGLAEFLARHAGQVTRQAPIFLAHAGLL